MVESIEFLDETNIVFPDPERAIDVGILALGGNLEKETILKAYRAGAFPWFRDGDVIQWWHPDPRFVIFPDEINISKSMRSCFNKGKFHITIDTEPEKVLHHCGTVDGRYNESRWLSFRMMKAYMELYKAGYLHSIEVRNEDNEMVGGLYGVVMGKVFHGESMFSLESNASKFALITLAKLLEKEDFTLIDCQMPTDHLASMGGRSITRRSFTEILKHNCKLGADKTDWSRLVEGIDYAELIK